MNILDILMLVGLVVGVMLGFVRGLVQQAMGLLSLYLSMVVGVWSHRVFGSLFVALFPSLSRPSADILGFMLAVIILLNALGFITRDFEKNAQWIQKMPALVNQTGGLVLGFITTAFWLGLAGTALVVIGQAPWIGAEGTHQAIVDLVDGSLMIFVFRYAFQLALYTAYPWIPGELPEIFTMPL